LQAIYHRIDDAGDTVAKIIEAGIIPATLELMDKMVIKALEDFAHLGLPLDAAAVLMIDVDGEVVGQVNGLSIYNLGGYLFGRPSWITASTSMGRAGIINIEREADMSGNTHNKGVLILGGYLRKKYAQDKPLTHPVPHLLYYLKGE
jgi:predicted ATP-dependent protease